jgi:hypothetical protein
MYFARNLSLLEKVFKSYLVTYDIFTSLFDLCSQIGLICRRAFEDTAGKIYVVMHAERIKFEAGMQIEQMVNHLFLCARQLRFVLILGTVCIRVQRF